MAVGAIFFNAPLYRQDSTRVHEKANLLNDVFANENTSLNPDASVFGPTNLQLTFNLEKITASEVRRVLRTLPNKSSCGSDRISYQMIKEAGPGLVGPLVSLFNASLRLRKVPDEWRKSIIKPIFKGGRKDRRDPSSYRPIALTSWVARTMEKVLNARILEYLQKTSLLYEHQSGIPAETFDNLTALFLSPTSGPLTWMEERMFNRFS